MRVAHQIKPKPVEHFICFMCLPISSPIGMYLRGWMVCVHCTLYSMHSFLPLLKPVTVAANLELILNTVNKTFSLFLPSSALSGEIKFSKNPCTMDLYFYIFERLTYERNQSFWRACLSIRFSRNWGTFWIFISILVGFSRACAPVRCAHPSFWAH